MATPVFGPPTISPARFAQVLRDAQSPVLAERPAQDYFAAIQAYGLDPAFLLAVFAHESRYGTDPRAVVNRYGTKNWGNTRSLVAQVPGSVVLTDRGSFVKFQTWLDGLKDACARLVAPGLPYVKAQARTVETVLPIWAPPTDQNNTAAYVGAVLGLMAQWRDAKTEGGPMHIIKDLLPDGLNHWSGRDGHQVRAVVIHTAEGLRAGVQSWFHNPDAEVSSQYLVCQNGDIIQFVDEGDTAWANGPIHNPADYPIIRDWVRTKTNPNRETISIETERAKYTDPYTDAQYQALVALVRDITSRYSIPRDEGHILGHMDLDSVNKAHCPGWSRDQWVQFMAAIQDVTTDQAPPPAPVTVPGDSPDAPWTFSTGQTVRGWFARRYRALGAYAVPMLGFPLTGELVVKIAGQDRTVQLFERGALVLDGSQPADGWGVTMATLDQLATIRQAAGK